MCGIAGAITNQKVTEGVVERATKALFHRGPDDGGMERIPFPSGEAVFGNRRLSIIDLSPAGHMPMRDPETGNWITYNGEIFNHLELRNELEQSGCEFTGHSDTEVILKAYARWGKDCLQRLRGMFAIAICDVRKQELFLARDRFGIKPLYFAMANHTFLFASELRAILKTGLVERNLNPAALYQYLSFGSVCDPETIVQNVNALLPGHYLVWKNGQVATTAYWNLADFAPKSEFSRNPPPLTEVTAKIRSLLEDSISHHMVSDVPVSIFLSGGIDSSALALLLHKMGITGVNSFSVIFKEADYSEAEQARLVAVKSGTNHHEILLSGSDALAAIPLAIAAMDQPSLDGVNSFVISRAVRQAGFKVALSGLGGDEVFAGYSTFSTVPKLEALQGFANRLPKPVQSALASLSSIFLKSNDQRRKYKSLLESNGTLHPYALLRMLFVPEQSNRLMSKLDSAITEQASAPLENSFESASSMDPVNRVSFLELSNYMRNTLLRDADAMSMASSLEVRVPFIDHRLIEYVLGLPGAMKLDSKTPKVLLTSALADLLPAEIVHRPKQGFTLPFEEWLRGDLRPSVEGMFSGKAAGPLDDWIHRAAVRQVWQSFQAGDTSWSRPWSLYVLQEWCRYNLE